MGWLDTLEGILLPGSKAVKDSQRGSSTKPRRVDDGFTAKRAGDRRRGDPLGRFRNVPKAPAATPIRVGDAPSGMTIDDLVGLYSTMMGSSGGGGGYSYSPALVDVDGLKARYANARTELGKRYGDSMAQLDGLLAAGNRQAARSSADARANQAAFEQSQRQVGSDYDRQVAELAGQLQAASQASGGVTDPSVAAQAQRDAALMNSQVAADNAARNRALADEALYEREIRAVTDQGARNQAREQRVDAETALGRAELEAILQAEQHNAAERAKASEAAAANASAGGSVDPLVMSAMIGQMVDGADAWAYPDRERAQQARLGVRDRGATLALQQLLDPSLNEQAALDGLPAMLRQYTLDTGRPGPVQTKNYKTWQDYEKYYTGMLRPIIQDYYRRSNSQLDPSRAQEMVRLILGGGG